MSNRPAAETVTIDPHLLVLFGVTGDLARRKLLPALFRLFRRREFADTLHVLGVARSELSDDDFREMGRKAIIDSGIDSEEAAAWCGRNLSYQPLGSGLEALRERIEGLEARHGLPGNRAFYLAIPPVIFEQTVEGLAKAGLNDGSGWVRIVVEKPFGTDLESARRLNSLLHRHYDERQIYRIDHFLAKETVQNLLVFRFANPLFELAWNRDRIASVQITVAETLGLEGRVGYLEGAGIIRDMVQNHILQLVSLVGMEPPVRMDADAIRDEKVKVLRSIYPVQPGDVVRGQYTAGEVGGRAVLGYLEEEGVAPASATETYAALRFEVDNWRWKGVPFLVRTGKRLARRLTQISVRFHEPPIHLFGEEADHPLHGNVLFITLQPHEGFDLMFDVKTPGEGIDVKSWPLSFRYEQAFGSLPDAYETLLIDVLSGDQTLFVRADEAEEAWRVLAPVLDLPDQPHPYVAGSWGPDESTRLLRDDTWRLWLDHG